MAPDNEEIHDVVDRGDAADANDRYPHRLGRLKDRPQGDRLDGGAAQSAHHPPQLRAPPPPVDGHAQAGVDQGDGVAAPGLGGAGNAGDIGHVGRQLGDNRHAARFADAGHHGLAHRRIGAEIDAAADVGAGDIQFQGIHAGQAVEPGRHVDELPLALARDADDDLRAQPGQIGQRMGDERLDAVVVQADRIEHAAAGFVGPRRRIARARMLRDGLWQNAPQAAKVDQAGHLPGVTKSPRSHQDRIGKTQPPQVHGKIDVDEIHVFGRLSARQGGSGSPRNGKSTSLGLWPRTVNLPDRPVLDQTAVRAVGRHMIGLVKHPEPFPFVLHQTKVLRRVNRFLRAAIRVARVSGQGTSAGRSRPANPRSASRSSSASDKSSMQGDENHTGAGFFISAPTRLLYSSRSA